MKTKAIVGVTLRKPCKCGRAAWPKCRGKGHNYFVINRVKARPGWPTACGGKGRLWLSLKQYAKRIGKPNLKIETKGEAEAVALLVIAEHADGTLHDTMRGARGPAAPAAPVADGVAVAGRTWAAVAALDYARRLPHWSCEKAAKAERHRNNVIARQRPDPARGPFGTWVMDTITGEDLEKVFRLAAAKCLEDERGNSSRLKYRRSIQRVCDEARRLRWIVASPIIKGETKLPVGLKGRSSQPAMRRRNMDVDFEAKAIGMALKLGDAGRRLAALILAIIETAARPGEVLAIKVSDVYLGTVREGRYMLDGYLMITAIEPGARKKRRPRPVPLSARLRPIVEGLLLDVDGRPLPQDRYVFGNATGRRMWPNGYRFLWSKVVLLASGITPTFGKGNHRQVLTPESQAAKNAIDIRLADCRHEAAQRWHMGRWVDEGGQLVFQPGIELNAIAEMMGHADLTTLKVYLGIGPDGALAAWRRSMGEATPMQPKRAVACTVAPFRRATARAVLVEAPAVVKRSA